MEPACGTSSNRNEVQLKRDVHLREALTPSPNSKFIRSITKTRQPTRQSTQAQEEKEANDVRRMSLRRGRQRNSESQNLKEHRGFEDWETRSNRPEIGSHLLNLATIDLDRVCSLLLTPGAPASLVLAHPVRHA